MLEQYLNYLQENTFKEKVKKILTKIGQVLVVDSEPQSCKKLRETSKYIYLYHGTRPEFVESIKKQGLKLSYHGKRETAEEGGIVAAFSSPRIYFGNVYDPSGYGMGGVFSRKEFFYLLAKLDTKYLKHEVFYSYFKDIPPNDLIWEDDPKFKKIGSESPCLFQPKR